MTSVIGKPYADAMDRACVDECPVDCIYEGGRALSLRRNVWTVVHVNPCAPVDAIYYQDDLPEERERN